MFEATANLIGRHGLARLTTNAIATECGVSIGSIYQYFPNKQALLLAMAEGEMNRSAAEVRAAVTEARAQGRPAADAAVAALFASTGSRQRVRLAMIEVAAQAGRSDLLLGPLAEMQGLLTTRAHRTMSWTAAFVVASAVVGVLRASLIDERMDLSDPELHAEVVRLITAFDRSEPT